MIETAGAQVGEGYGTEFILFITRDERTKCNTLRNVFRTRLLTTHIKKIDATYARMPPERLTGNSVCERE